MNYWSKNPLYFKVLFQSNISPIQYSVNIVFTEIISTWKSLWRMKDMKRLHLLTFDLSLTLVNSELWVIVSALFKKNVPIALTTVTTHSQFHTMLGNVEENIGQYVHHTWWYELQNRCLLKSNMVIHNTSKIRSKFSFSCFMSINYSEFVYFEMLHDLHENIVLFVLHPPNEYLWNMSPLCCRMTNYVE